MRVAKLPLEILMSTNKGKSETDVVIDEKSHLRTLRSTTLTFELDLDNVKIIIPLRQTSKGQRSVIAVDRRSI